MCRDAAKTGSTRTGRWSGPSRGTTVVLSILLIATIALLGGISGVVADDIGDGEWPQYQSDTTNTGAIDTSGPGGELSTAWSALDDHVHSSPAIVDDVVYVGSNDGSVYALDAATGEEKWSLEIGDSVESSPVVTQDIVYVGNDSGGLFAIDADTGEEKWSHTYDVGGFTESAKAVSTPAVSDGYVFAHVGSGLHAHDVTDGTEQWNARSGHQLGSPPAPTVKDGVVYVGAEFDAFRGSGGYVRGFDVDNGDEVFSPGFSPPPDGAPAVTDDTLYLGGGGVTYGYMYAFNVATESEKWVYETDGSKTAPTVVDDRVYFGNREAGSGSEYHVIALNATTGEEEWTFELENRIDGSPAVVDGRVYATDYNGNVYTLDAENGELLESTQLRDPDDSRTMFTSPVVTEDTVYIGANVFGSDDDTFYALRDGDEDDLAPSDIRVVSASLGATEIEAGESVTITAKISNDGDAAGVHTAELEIDGTVEDDETVEVGPTRTEAVEFTHTFDDAGDFEVSVDGVDAGTVTVREADGTSPSPSPSPSPDPEPKVSVEPIADGAAVSVTDAIAGEPISIPLADAVGDDDVVLAWLNVTTSVDADFDVRIEADDELPAGVEELPNEATVVQSLEVESTLEDEEIETATFEFTVSADELDARGLESDDVTLYHYDDGEWVDRETEVVAYPGDMWDELEEPADLFPGDTWDEAGVDDPEALFPGDTWEEAEGPEDLFPGDTWEEAEEPADLFPGDHWEEAGVDDPEALFPGDTWEEAEEPADLFPGDTWNVATIDGETPHFSAFALAGDQPASDPVDGDDGADVEDDESDGIPGFGVLVAVGAVLAVGALLARTRS